MENMALFTASNFVTESKDGILQVDKAAKRREYARKWRQQNKERKTEYCRKWREKFAREHPEKDAAQKKKAFDTLHQLQKTRIMRETPEQRTVRLKKISEYKRQIILMETPEQKAARLEKNRLYWQKMKLNETPEQKQARIDREKRYKQKSKIAKALKREAQDNTKRNPMPTVNAANLSNEEPLRLCLVTEDNARLNATQERTSDAFCSKISHNDHQRKQKNNIVEESLNCMKNLLKKRKKLDGNELFGKCIASKFRNCNRATYEVDIARRLIDDVLKKLTETCSNQCPLTVNYQYIGDS